MKPEKLLIIPDVHGRTFWKQPCHEADDFDKIIFLGDYVDPYPRDGINELQALDNFTEILSFAEQGQDKVVMLYGNHDLHYVSEYYLKIAGGCRYSRRLAPQIRKMFEDHKQLFRFCYETELSGGSTVLFSHAGVSPLWYKEQCGFEGAPDVDRLNGMLSTEKDIELLAQVGWSRGGNARVGSMVWCDVYEFSEHEKYEGIYQVFGHTQQLYGPVIDDTFACLDCREAFVMTGDGKLTQIQSRQEPSVGN